MVCPTSFNQEALMPRKEMDNSGFTVELLQGLRSRQPPSPFLFF